MMLRDPDEGVEHTSQQIIDIADDQISDTDRAPFTAEAWAVVRAYMATYIRDLLLDSARISARLRNGESITSTDVKHAARQLTTGTADDRGHYAGLLGGLLAGAGLGNLLSILTSDGEAQPIGIVVTTFILVVGTGLMVWDLSGRRR